MSSISSRAVVLWCTDHVAHTDDELANFALQSVTNINGYNRDSLVSIGNTLVETSFKTPERLRNKYAVRYVSMGLMKRAIA